MFDTILAILLTAGLVGPATWGITHYVLTDRMFKLRETTFHNERKIALQSYDAGWTKGVAYGRVKERAEMNRIVTMHNKGPQLVPDVNKARKNDKGFNES